MSVVSLLNSGMKSFYRIVAGLGGWLIIAPLAIVIPKSRRWIAIIGRDDGKFLDNAKYFMLQAKPLLSGDYRLVFVTERDDVMRLLVNNDYETLGYPSWVGLWFLLRVGTVVVDSSEWVWKWRRFLLVGARKIQLWHGVGFKRIEYDKWQHEANEGNTSLMPGLYQLRKLVYLITGRLVLYDIVNTTSAFYRDQVFTRALPGKYYTTAGYPRNTFGELDDAVREMAWINTDQKIAENMPKWQAEGQRIVLVAPTFRDTRGLSLSLTAETASHLNNWCHVNRVEMVFKFHPVEKTPFLQTSDHLHMCDPNSDLYPLMPKSSALITDYSSIYMDYLLLDKPVLFFVPDIDEYMAKDRQIQFDFNIMTPGPKLHTWQELTTTLSEQLHQDTFATKRAKLRALAFDGHDQTRAVPELIAIMQQNHWLPSADTSDSHGSP